MSPPPKIAKTQQSPQWTPGGATPAKKRNAIALVAGAVLVLLGGGLGAACALSATSAPATKAAKAVELRRAVVFGTAAALTGVPGFVLIVFGMRRR
ncbi:MAG TPA: hypothetical protein VHB21_23855 [Minicystis sp.]|nr:hypothetical protein [Minicystis sp.]